MRSDLIETVRATMQGAGFIVSERCDLRPVSFDLVARRGKDLVMLKILTNVDALSETIAHEIKLLCKFLDARPVLVGLRSGTGPLEPGVVYARHDIPIVNPDTLNDFLVHGAAPMAFAAPGGFYVRVDAEALRRAREIRHLSLGVVAQIAGVSRRAIQMYEEGMSASIEAAMRLEEYLESDLIQPVDPFASFDPARYEPPPEESAEDPMEQLVTRLLQGLGYSVRQTRRSPFDALSTDGEKGPTFLTGMAAEDSPQLRRRARVVHSVSEVTQRPGFFVVERTTRTTIEGMPVVTRVELRRLTDPESIRDLLMERQGTPG
ncbi:MAG: transcriptional regulator [Thermoplasmatota archaeon]